MRYKDCFSFEGIEDNLTIISYEGAHKFVVDSMIWLEELWSRVCLYVYLDDSYVLY